MRLDHRRLAVLTILPLLCLAFVNTGTVAQPTDSELIAEHVYEGLPTDETVFVRQGYVSCYDDDSRIPKWVAYHVTQDYRNTPERTGRHSSFRKDKEVNNAVVSDDYTGLFRLRGYARGHLAPYAVMGGDRDGDGNIASTGTTYDDTTIFQANYMSNIAPQHHTAFNGSGGLWFNLERWIQDELVDNRGEEVWVFAGCILGPGEHEGVGPDNDIVVPPMFYKIVIREPEEGEELPRVLAFLFPHQRAAHGEIEDFLVSVDVIEAMTNLDFFPDLDDELEEWLEDKDTWEFWDE